MSVPEFGAEIGPKPLRRRAVNDSKKAVLFVYCRQNRGDMSTIEQNKFRGICC